MSRFLPEALASEWLRRLDAFPLDIRSQVLSLAERHKEELAGHFYESMLQDASASVFLTHAEVKNRLHGSMQRWIIGVFALGVADESRDVMMQQVHVGQVHARIGIPVHLVLRGARILKEQMFMHVWEDFTGNLAGRLSAFRFVSESIDLAMEMMSYAYSSSHERNSRTEEAYRLFAVTQNIASERERQRAALLAWENQLMFEQAVGLNASHLPRISPSEFGLWFRHKGAHAFEGAPETVLILNGMRQIDEVLLAGFDAMRSGGDREEYVRWLREVREQVAGIAFHLERLFEQNNELESGRDVLTRLLNRKFLPVVLSRQVAYARESNSGFAILALDLDFFKRINDDHGHEAGDRVLQQFTTLLLNNSRAGDYLFRLGGEEFLMLLVDITPGDARRVAEKLRLKVAEEAFRLPRGEQIHVTLSIGLAMFDGHPDYQQLMRRADEALYQAKNGGRNRVVAE